jgi:hypothetical protein
LIITHKILLSAYIYVNYFHVNYYNLKCQYTVILNSTLTYMDLDNSKCHSKFIWAASWQNQHMPTSIMLVLSWRGSYTFKETPLRSTKNLKISNRSFGTLKSEKYEKRQKRKYTWNQLKIYLKVIPGTIWVKSIEALFKNLRSFCTIKIRIFKSRVHEGMIWSFAVIDIDLKQML